MTDIQMVLVTIVGVIYVLFGAITAITDVCNQESNKGAKKTNVSKLS